MKDKIFNNLYKEKKTAIQLGLFISVGFFIWFLFGVFGNKEIKSSVYFLDIGQGDAQMLLLEPPKDSQKRTGGQRAVKIMIDAGGGRQIISALNNAGVGQDDEYIDIILVTHAHEDHFAGFIEVVKNYTVGVFIYNGQNPTTSKEDDYQEVDLAMWQILMEELEKQDIPIVILREGDTIRYGDTKLSIISPNEELLAMGDLNEASLVALAEVATKNDDPIKILFTGDIGLSTEKILLEQGVDLSADILKVGHHGSKHSSGANFIHAVSPTMGVIGVGENRYGHPAKEVVKTLETAGSFIYSTKDYGTVKIPLNRSDKTKTKQEGLLANLADLFTGSYQKSRLTTVTLADALDVDKTNILIPFEKCEFHKPKGKIDAPIRINEVAWMGAISGSTHEWIELTKNSDPKINITGWQLINENGKIHATFPQGTIFENDFIILARATANEALALSAELVFTGAIRNSNEGLRLFNNRCNLVDEVFAKPNWPAGENSTRKTMERSTDFGWTTSKDSNGTPRFQKTKDIL